MHSTHSRSFGCAIACLLRLGFLVNLSKITSLMTSHRLLRDSLLPKLLSNCESNFSTSFW
jgi:hypothetical protein